jgi:tripartite-type tricarboxylate transporter receptor subunit TctC
MEKELGQPIVVTNMAGAGSSVASRAVKDAPPDGYTVLFNHINLLTVEVMGIADFGFEDLKTAAIVVEDNSGIFIVPSNSKYKTMQDIIDASKKSPKSVKVSTETGAFSHMQWLALQDATGIQLHLMDVGPFAQVLAALLSDTVDFAAVQYIGIKDYMLNGDFKALAAVGVKRFDAMPDLPTCKEMGIDIEFPKTFGFWFPKATPDAIVDKFNAAYAKVYQSKEYQDYCKNVSFVEGVNITGQDAVDYWRSIKNGYMSLKDKVTSVEKVAK